LGQHANTYSFTSTTHAVNQWLANFVMVAETTLSVTIKGCVHFWGPNFKSMLYSVTCYITMICHVIKLKMTKTMLCYVKQPMFHW